MPSLPAAGLLALAALLVSPPAHGRVWTDIDHLVKGPASPAALRFVQAHAARFGAGSDVALKVRRVIPIKGGEVVRLAQSGAGRPVLNAGLSVLILNGRMVAAAGGLTRAAPPADKGMSLERARQAALRVWPGARVRADAGAGLWQTGGELRPAWSLLVRTERPFGVWRVVLDARTGQVLSSVSALISVQGKAYLPNPVMGSLGTVELVGLLQPTELAGELADTASCASTGGQLNCTRYAAPDTSGDFLYSPDEPSFEDPFAEVHAYYHVDLFHRWLADSFGFARAGTSQQIKVMVNFNFETQWGSTKGFYNALFGDMDDDGKGDLLFGQGKKDFSYDADVIYHEFTHSAVDETSNLEADIDELGFNVMPMALNEGFADYFSCAFAGDPNVGEYAGGSGGIRDLSGMASCPDDLSGESHNDGLLWGRACWTIRTKVADPSAFDDMVYKTMVSLDTAATIADAADMLLKVAAAIDPTVVPTIQSELTSRGLTDCTRIIPLAQGDIRAAYIYGDSAPDAVIVVPGPFQYKIEVPANATRLTIELASMGSWHSWEPSLGLYIRKGEPVVFSSYKSTYDFVMPNPETSITLEVGHADKTLEPGAVYYVLPLNVGDYESAYQVSCSMVLEPPPPPPDAGPPPLEPDAGPPLEPEAGPTIPASPEATAEGCSCHVNAAGSSTGAPLLLLVGLLLLGLRRRRR